MVEIQTDRQRWRMRERESREWRRKNVRWFLFIPAFVPSLSLSHFSSFRFLEANVASSAFATEGLLGRETFSLPVCMCKLLGLLLVQSGLLNTSLSCTRLAQTHTQTTTHARTHSQSTMWEENVWRVIKRGEVRRKAFFLSLPLYLLLREWWVKSEDARFPSFWDRRKSAWPHSPPPPRVGHQTKTGKKFEFRLSIKFTKASMYDVMIYERVQGFCDDRLKA